MPRILGVATALPPFAFRQSEVKSFAHALFSEYRDIDRLLPVFDNALIDQRHFVSDIEWFRERHSFTELNDLYIKFALELTEQATLSLLDKVSVAANAIDAIIFVSTTGISTPSIDARLFNRIPFSNHIVRMPIWGLGCAAGAGGIARAFDYAKAHPAAKVLVLSVELCSLAFQHSPSKENLVASALFGDGAAACLVVGDEAKNLREDLHGPEILGSLSTIYPDSLDVMGWQIGTEGLKVILSKDIPTIVTTLVQPNIEELLGRFSLLQSDIKHYVTHPGGAKVLDAYESALSLDSAALGKTREVLRLNGNMSSATIFFILKSFLDDRSIKQGEYGLLSALGPGFSSELVLVQW